MKEIIFSEYKEKILEALNEKNLGIPEDVNIVDGFTYIPYQQKISEHIKIGGPTIPLVMLIGKETSRVYFIALRALLPEIKTTEE